MIISLKNLLDRGRTAAERWRECDDAIASMQDAYGQPYDDARSVLTSDLTVAEAEGFDVKQFSGKKNPFRFEDINASITVKIYKKPSAHEDLDAMDKEISEFEKELKVLKAKRKALIEELLLHEKIVNNTDKIVTAFSSFK